MAALRCEIELPVFYSRKGCNRVTKNTHDLKYVHVRDVSEPFLAADDILLVDQLAPGMYATKILAYIPVSLIPDILSGNVENLLPLVEELEPSGDEYDLIDAY